MKLHRGSEGSVKNRCRDEEKGLVCSQEESGLVTSQPWDEKDLKVGSCPPDQVMLTQSEQLASEAVAFSFLLSPRGRQ